MREINGMSYFYLVFTVCVCVCVCVGMRTGLISAAGLISDSLRNCLVAKKGGIGKGSRAKGMIRGVSEIVRHRLVKCKRVVLYCDAQAILRDSERASSAATAITRLHNANTV